jgi:tripartite-type tricarboxylate transporter receptor subunit TctC
MRLLLAALALLLSAGGVRAQGFPDHMLRIVSGSAAGGSSDFVARSTAEAVGTVLGQRIVVENRTGVNGVIAAEAVATSPPDGYTTFVCPMSTMTMTPQLLGPGHFDPGAELAPIAMVGLSSYGLVVRRQSPFKSLADILAAARARPGQLTFASPGVGAAQHLGMELLKQQTHTDMVHVPFRGAAPAIMEIIAGRVDFTLTNLGDAVRQLQDGELRLLAIGDDTPQAVFPDAPRVSTTVPGFSVMGWFGLCSRRDLPSAIIASWEDAVRRVMADEEHRARLRAGGITPLFEDRATFTRRVEADRARWLKVIQGMNVRAD